MLSFLVRYNFYIGLAVVSVAALSQFRLTGSIHADPWFGFLFFSSQWLYNFSQYFTNSLREKPIQTFSDALNRAINFMLGFKGWFPALAAFPFFLYLDLYRLWPLLPAALISITYSFPFRPPGKGVVRLRDLTMAKGLMIALVWAVMTTLIPVLHLVQIDDPILWIHFLERTAFIFALAIGADLFDMQWENEAGMHTLAHQIGRKGMLRLINIGMFISGILIIALYFLGENEHPFFLFLLLLTCPLSAIIINKLEYGLDEIKDYLIIDGFIILQGLIYLPLFLGWM